VKSFLQPKWKNRGDSVVERYNVLRPFVQGKSLFDVGCAVGYKRPFWLHGELSKIASTAVGIDIDQGAVDEISQMHPHVQVQTADARSFSLGQQFDIVHAGELIEHIDNFNGFFSSVKQHLLPDGKLLLSTPNADYYTHLLYNLTGGLHVNEEHVCWFCVKTLSTLITRNGFEILEFKYLQQPTYGLRKVAKGFSNLLPERVSKPTLFVVARPV
jgi:2-polyprenyl-3-methyl-5-hydroxy-6-metoxy-1,4-benzoquinol methylase